MTRPMLDIYAGVIVPGADPGELRVALTSRPPAHPHDTMVVPGWGNIGDHVCISISVNPAPKAPAPPKRDMRGAPSRPGPA